MTSTKYRHLQTIWLPLVLTLAIAFALRVNAIERQSIWYDEGLSIHYARGNVGEILRGVSASDHPPLHPLLLHFWMDLCGDSELAVRLFSIWWGVLAVALIYRLGARISETTGILAALLLAVSPFAVWFSQETRGYTMALALITSTVNVTFDLWAIKSRNRTTHQTDHWSLDLGYILGATTAWYTHFYSSFVLLALNLACLIQVGKKFHHKKTRRQILRWMYAQIAVLLLFTPWIPFVAAQLDANATYWHGAVGWRQIVRRTVTAFSIGKTLDGPWAIGATWAMSFSALLGTWILFSQPDDRRTAIILWSCMLIPTSVLILINRRLPKFSPRYLMNALPMFLILASTGIVWIFRFVRQRVSTAKGWIALVVLLSITATLGGATTRSLANHYLNKQSYRPDFRAVVEYIENHATPNDLIVLVGGHSYPAFTYYYRGTLPVLPLPDKLLPTTRQPIDLNALGTLNQAIVGRQNLWLVLWQASLADPTGLIVDEIEQTYHRLGVGRTFHDIALLLFDVSPGPLLPENAGPQTLLHAHLGDQVRLQGYDLPVQTTYPGGTLYLYLYWESLTDILHDYKVFTQILDQDGHIIAQQDKMAGAQAYPTSHWPPGALVRDRFLLTVRREAKPGQYQLIAGLYDPGPGLIRLPTHGEGAYGDYILIAEIEIQNQ
jgi:hypothetical protein